MSTVKYIINVAVGLRPLITRGCGECFEDVMEIGGLENGTKQREELRTS